MELEGEWEHLGACLAMGQTGLGREAGTAGVKVRSARRREKPSSGKYPMPGDWFGFQAQGGSPPWTQEGGQPASTAFLKPGVSLSYEND